MSDDLLPSPSVVVNTPKNCPYFHAHIDKNVPIFVYRACGGKHEKVTLKVKDLSALNRPGPCKSENGNKTFPAHFLL